MKLKSLLLSVCVACAATCAAYAPKGVIYVNEDVTTHIVMPENIKLVDLSTDMIVGNQCAANMLRIKPVIESDSLEAGAMLGNISIVGERNIAQFEVRYCPDPSKAEALHTVVQETLVPYNNPEVTMPEGLMSKLAWALYCSGRKYNNITSKANGLKAQVNNIYSVGDYFFIDFSIDNKTNIPYDIEEIRIKLADKKEAKATNVQTIELSPVFSLNTARRFKKAYRNVLVVDKLTFPDEKVLTLELSEAQISGRVISLNMEYEDILNADGFDPNLIHFLDSDRRLHISK